MSPSQIGKGEWQALLTRGQQQYFNSLKPDPGLPQKPWFEPTATTVSIHTQFPVHCFSPSLSETARAYNI